MELFENTYVQIWLGVGLLVAIGGLIIDKSMYNVSAGEFKDDEFSVGMFLFFIVVGPIGLIGLAIFFLKDAADDVANGPARKKANEEFLAKMEADREAAAQRDRENRKKKKTAARDFISSELATLTLEMDRALHEAPVNFLEQVVLLGAHARALKLNDVTDQEKREIVSVIRYARINASSLAADALENEQVKLVKALSDELVKLNKKYKKALEAA